MYLNKVLVAGNIGNDLELKYTQSGQAVLNFRLAVERGFKSEGQEKPETDWLDVVCWRKTAEFVHERLAKGCNILVEGKLQVRSWDDRESGKKRYSTEIVADDVRVITWPKDDGRQAQGAQAQAAPVQQYTEANPYTDANGDKWIGCEGNWRKLVAPAPAPAGPANPNVPWG